jgi:hypothetical protein
MVSWASRPQGAVATEKEKTMSSSLKRIGKLGPLVLSSAAFALAGPAVSGAQVAQKTALAATAQLARHFQHEDALSAKLSRVETGAATAAMALHFNHEDALYAARQTLGQGRTPTQAIALHFRHEDAIYGAKQDRPAPRTSSQLMALHFQHEDALYRKGFASGEARSASAAAAAPASGGFDWNDVLLTVAGSAVAAMLLSVGAIVGIRRGRSRLAQS